MTALCAAVLPKSTWPLVLPLVTGPSTILTLIATLIAGFAMLHHERLREALRVNTIYRAVVEMLPDCLNSKSLDGRLRRPTAPPPGS